MAFVSKYLVRSQRYAALVFASLISQQNVDFFLDPVLVVGQVGL